MKNIIKIIGKLNTAFLAIIVALYIACLALILIAINPKHNYDIEPDYQHQTQYQEISNSFQVAFRRSKNGNDIVETYAYRFGVTGRTSNEDKTDPGFSIVKYQTEYKQSGSSYYYFNDVTNASTSWAKTTYVGEGHEPKKFFGKLHYIDQNNEEKVIKIKEEIFEAPKSFDDYSDGNKIKFENAEFTYQVVKTTQDNDYNVTMRLVSSTNRFFHADLQTWIESDDGSIYPFVGAYGQSSTWNVVSEKVIGELKAKTLYCKLICYYENDTFEMHYKVNFRDMKEQFADFENIDANKVEVKATNNTNKIIAFAIVAAVCVTITTVIVVALVRSKKNKGTN